ncbi:MAG: two-component sensor histidine kinase, partial [Mogibacterium sp.]|nr:two-component sensor histidine kinase [Mogibacterium sp.]
LVQNGIRYNNAGGYVRVSVRHEDGHAVLIVRDNGIGIAKEKQSRVFERFYRVDKSRSRDSGGTGLGLALVKHIAEIHNADIEMDSAPGAGTEISVHFPEINREC